MKIYERLFILGIITLLVLPLIISLDNSLPLSCGGNQDVVIGCLNSEDLIFLGSLIPEERAGQQAGVGPDYIHIEKPQVKKKVSFFSNLNKFLLSEGLSQIEIYILWIFLFGIFLSFLFLVFKRKEKKGKKSLTYSRHHNLKYPSQTIQ